MPELLSVADLDHLRTEAQHGLRARLATTALITIHMGACGVAAGARATAQALAHELSRRSLMARVAVADCAGTCADEPLVDVQLPGATKVTYRRVNPAMVPRLIEEHLVQGHPVIEWTQPAA